MRLILLGPPGSGKGTQAKLLAERLATVHISTGDILREAARLGTPMGLLAKPFMESGKYVPDNLVNDIIAERFRRPDRPESFLMDGYPRTLAQAVAFDQVLRQEYLGLDACLLLLVPDEEIISRVTGRRVCPNDGSLYHVTHSPPKKTGVCDCCGGPLEIRSDDREETVRARLKVFHTTMPDVIEHYRRQGLLREANGKAAINDVFHAILRSLGVNKE